MSNTETKAQTEVVTIWVVDDEVIIGRELSEEESDELTKEQLIQAVKNAGYCVIVKDDREFGRVYINVTEDSDWVYDRGSFEIDPSLPCFNRLWNAITHEDLYPVRCEDGGFILRYEHCHHRRKAEVQINADGSFKVVKILDDEAE